MYKNSLRHLHTVLKAGSHPPSEILSRWVWGGVLASGSVGRPLSDPMAPGLKNNVLLHHSDCFQLKHSPLQGVLTFLGFGFWCFFFFFFAFSLSLPKTPGNLSVLVSHFLLSRRKQDPCICLKDRSSALQLSVGQGACGSEWLLSPPIEWVLWEGALVLWWCGFKRGADSSL